MHRSKAEEGEESKEGGGTSSNAFKNDGSFMEMFKKMQEEKEEKEKEKEVKEEEKKVIKRPLFGKRRGGRKLPTGKVKKPKMPSEADGPITKDAWSVYLEEVRRYKETTCEEDGKTRPLVK